MKKSKTIVNKNKFVHITSAASGKEIRKTLGISSSFYAQTIKEIKGGIMLSEKEQKLLDFIKEEGEVTIKQIAEELSESHVGALGKLLGKELIVSDKKRGTNPNNRYGVKYIKYYKIKED